MSLISLLMAAIVNSGIIWVGVCAVIDTYNHKSAWTQNVTPYAPAARPIRIAGDVNWKRRNLARRWLIDIVVVEYLPCTFPLPPQRIDNTDIVRCEHSFRPDGTISRSSPRFFLAFSLPARFRFSFAESLLHDELKVARHKATLICLPFIFYIANCTSLRINSLWK